MSDPNKRPVQAPPALTARALMRSRDRATLATALAAGRAFWPYASLVLIACDLDASPLLLISALAEHTKNLRRDPKASLLFDGTAGRDDPLTGPRVTVLGEIVPEDDADALARFTRRHPAAAAYAGFRDFHLHRMRVERAHLVAGFGRIDWIEGAELLDQTPSLDWLRRAEAGVLQHMNADHADTLDRYAQSLLGLAGTGWQLTGIDGEGGDLRRAGEVARLSFPSPVTDVSDIRQVFVALAQSAQRGARSQ
jgi:putative heme iron utilization protein